MTTLEKSEAEIRRLVIRLMDLSLGCKILLDNGSCLDNWEKNISDDEDLAKNGFSDQEIRKINDYEWEKYYLCDELMDEVIIVDYYEGGDEIYRESGGETYTSLTNPTFSFVNADYEVEKMDYNEKTIKIIGHPITLSAIKDVIKIKFKDDEELRKKLFGEICEMWEYDEQFSQQKPEVHKFVANILFS